MSTSVNRLNSRTYILFSIFKKIDILKHLATDGESRTKLKVMTEEVELSMKAGSRITLKYVYKNTA